MIQRVQSILLGLVAILYILLFFIPVFSWQAPTSEAGDSWNLTALYNFPFIVMNVLIILFSIFSISQFKNRKKQRTYVLILCIVIILNVCLYMYYMYTITAQNEYVLQPAKSIGIYFQLISIILCLIAARRIKKDDDLVKSIDRIR